MTLSKVRKQKVQPRSSKAKDGLRQLSTQAVGGDRDGAERDAEKEAVRLAEDNGRNGLQPAKGSVTKQCLRSMSVHCRQQRPDVEKPAKMSKLQPSPQQIEKRGRSDDAGNAVEEVGESSGGGEGKQARNYADSNRGAV